MENNLTIEQIQAVIDRGGCLISDENEIHYGRIEIKGNKIYYEFSKMSISGCTFHEGCYDIRSFAWREATPEEIEKYVPVEHIPKSEKTYTEAELISFGNYLLSKEREEMVTSKHERGVAECAIVIRQVSDADFENWMAK